MLRVGIVGCGKIADSHGAQIARVKDCKIVGVCDREPLMAEQFCERFEVPEHFSSVAELLSAVRPDVVHITTPPQSHFEVAKDCLESGCHVYVEKPFTIDEHEAQKLIQLATQKGLKITVGHDEQFSHVGRRMRGLVRDGYLGGGPLHMESYYCYEIESSGYSGALLGDKGHWVRQLPGKLLHNIISHGVARIAEYLTSDCPEVIAYGFVSPLLKKLGERELIDELRVIIAEESGTTAYFTFSSQMRPSLRHFRLYGAKNGLMLDQDEEMLVKLSGGRYKSYVEKVVPHLTMARQHIGNVMTNAGRFLARDFQMKSGMKYLIETFYRSVREDTPVPIPYREILLTARIMDAIFAQLHVRSAHRDSDVLQTVR